MEDRLIAAGWIRFARSSRLTDLTWKARSSKTMSRSYIEAFTQKKSLHRKNNRLFRPQAWLPLGMAVSTTDLSFYPSLGANFQRTQPTSLSLLLHTIAGARNLSRG